MSRWRELRIRRRAAGLLASPYYEWTQATRFAYYGKGKWLPLLLELRDTTAQEFARRVLEMQERKKGDQEWTSQLRVPRFYASRPERLSKPTRFLAVLATKEFLEGVYRGAEPSGSIQRFELGRAVEPSSTANLQTGASKPPKKKGFKGKPKVVTGVIDDGIAFAHERFWSTDKTTPTRIEYFWDQLAPSDVWDDWGYGSEIDKRDPAAGIDRRMSDSRHGALVDEDELYRRSGHVDHTQPGHKPLARRIAHGTHVADLAAAAHPRPGPGQRPIVAVQLPIATTADTSGTTLGPQIYNGLAYILHKAEAIATEAKTGQLPVVVNVSYGIIAGPHDGSSMLEAAMDELLDSCNPGDDKDKPPTPRFRVVLPAGNNHLSRCHACVSLEAGESEELHWRVLPDDWTESYVEIWLPDSDDDGADLGLAITITAPGGVASTAFSVGEGQALEIAGEPVAQAIYYPPGEVGRRAMVCLALAPTGCPEGGIPLAPAGVWRIRIDNAGGKARVCGIHAWIQRDDTPVGYPRRGRQSYFDDPRYARFDDGGRVIESDAHPLTAASYVKREGTINAIATGKHPIVIGGIRRSDWAPAGYSACGPVVDYPPGREGETPDGPDAMTVSEDTPSHHGVLAAGCRSGSRVAMSGTSVAAPQIARWIAGELAANRSGNRRAVAQYTQRPVARPLYTEQNPPPGAAPKPPRKRGGAGRIEFEGGARRFER